MLRLSVVAAWLASLWCQSMSIPVYGTTRYGRPAVPAPAPSGPLYYRPARLYPYTDNYADDLYYRPMPVVHYPYYPMTRPEDVYRSLHPYYYAPYAYYGNEDTYEPVEDSPMELRDDSSRGSGSRSEALPVGQETWFEGDSSPSWRTDYDDVNAAFLRNLIMSQMYDEALDENNDNSEDSGRNVRQNSDEYEDHKNQEYYGERDTRDFEDEDVRELKALAGKPLYHVPKTGIYSAVGAGEAARRSQAWRHEFSTPKSVRSEDDHHINANLNDDYQNDEGWINWGSKRNAKPSKIEAVKRATTMKPGPVSTTTTTMAPMKIVPIISNKGLSGQKEEVLLRPATPARHPFPEPILHMIAANSPNQIKRTPSVYDTIKRLLSMEESYKPNTEIKSRMQKRYIATEDDLVGELKGLKRRSTA